MKAIGLTQYLPIDNPSSLMDVALPTPVPGERDLLVRVEAISVNPVDCKVRISKPGITEATPRVLGWDAAGVVEAAGSEAVLARGQNVAGESCDNLGIDHAKYPDAARRTSHGQPEQ